MKYKGAIKSVAWVIFTSFFLGRALGDYVVAVIVVTGILNARFGIDEFIDSNS